MQYYLKCGPVKIPQKMNGTRINWHAVGILTYKYFKGVCYAKSNI